MQPNERAGLSTVFVIIFLVGLFVTTWISLVNLMEQVQTYW